MEENRTYQALDEIADLFLTSPGSPDTESPPPPGVGSFAGPAPMRLTPKLPPFSREASRGVSPRPDAADKETGRQGDKETRLAGAAQPPVSDIRHQTSDIRHSQPPLRLYRDEAQRTTAATPDRPGHIEAAIRAAIERGGKAESSDARAARRTADAQPLVEAVLLGNLPGLSGPWLIQYAQRLAQQRGPVAVLHIDGQRMDMELVEPTDQSLRAGRLTLPTGADALVAQLETLATVATAPIRTVLIHLDPAGEEAPAHLLELDRCTVLTGADRAAVAAVARMLERLVAAEPSLAGKPVGLMMLGSDDQASEQAAAQVRQATAFLETPVRLVAAQQQMMPVNLRQLGRFGPTDALWPELVQWLRAFDADEAPSPVADEAPAEAPMLQPAMADEDDPFADDEQALQTATEEQGEPAWRQAREAQASRGVPPEARQGDKGKGRQGDKEPSEAPSFSREAPPEVPPFSREAQRSAPSDISHPTSDIRHSAPDLAQLLATGRGGVTGGIALEARCPHQPHTQLLLDQAGRLHLLHRHTAVGQDETAALASLRAAVVELLQAQRWVDEHLAVLQLTQRQCQFDAQAAPALHLFTDRPDLATPLAARLGSMLKLHLLEAITLGSDVRWYCTALN